MAIGWTASCRRCFGPIRVSRGWTGRLALADALPLLGGLQAAQGLPGICDLLMFTLGAFLMRSAGSTINDMADRNFDGRVERTRFRPLANGEISLIWAMVFLAAQLVPAASLLVFLAPFARLLAVGMLPLVVVYPFCKRFIHWPQATPVVP